MFLARLMASIFLVVLFAGNVYSAQSTITDVDGYSCLGEDKSRKQAEKAALEDARRRAGELAMTHLKSETRLKNNEFEKDIIEAYTNASIKVLQELEKGWYRDEAMGDCYRVKIKAEVTPEENKIEKPGKSEGVLDDPGAPLIVKIWADRNEYRKGDRINLFIKGNKPFYARVVYKDAEGGLVQLLPNPYRADNYFNGGTVYQLPSGSDRFELEVSPPFGEESITVYASTAPLGEISIKPYESVYRVMTDSEKIGLLTRGVRIVPASAEAGSTAPSKADIAEFSEEMITVKIR